MQISQVLLALFACVGTAFAATCANGAGILTGSACCPKSCGACGGSGCETRPGGQSSCCTQAIYEAKKTCGSPPCVVGAPAPAPTVPAAGSCASGTGIFDSAKVACCAKGCGRCGGTGCAELPGGAASCCSGTIKTAAKTCGTAPCVVGAPAPAPSPAPAGNCGGGTGYLNADKTACCPVSCTRCGGAACDKLPGGASQCCSGNVVASGKTCGSAPCKVGAPAPAPTPSGGSCANGTGIFNAEGTVCCPNGCGKCGGAGCDLRAGGAKQCCSGDVLAANKQCGTAPCVKQAV